MSKRRRAGHLTPTQRRERFDALHQMGCIVCARLGRGWVQPEIHHLRGHPWSGIGQRATDAHTIPLCHEHHRGKHGYHSSPREFEISFGSQQALLAQVDAYIRHAAEQSL